MTDDGTPDPDGEFLRRALSRYRPPPHPDTERMWAGIRTGVESASTVDDGRTSRTRSALIVVASASVAAALSLAVFRSQVTDPPYQSSAARAVETHRPKIQPSSAVKSIARDHVTEAEQVLVALARAERDDTRGGAQYLARSAENLLAGNRVLRSIAALPPELDGLLKDLDLVFTQLAAARQNNDEVHFAAMTVRERDIVGRIQRMHDSGDTD